jgi:predicted metal-dependent HD superfamily phosphohydrolase
MEPTLHAQEQSTLPDSRELEEQFHTDVAALGGHHDVLDVFGQLCAAYTAEDRKYHCIEHIAECLAWLDAVRSTLESPSEVAMALWFHDAVYATHPFAASEARSANLALTACLRMGIDGASARRIAEMIRATKDHELTGASQVHERDALALFDIDLAILGAEPVRYARFERDVRAEYSWMPEGIFRGRRAKLLRSLGGRPAIYRTPFMHERLEARARNSIERAVGELESKVDALVLHATDEQLFATRAARLEVVHSWTELHYVSVWPALSGASVQLGVAFASDDDRALRIAFDAPYAAEVVERLRAIPDYDHEAERRGQSLRVPAIVYSRERHPAIVGPLRPREVVATPNAMARTTKSERT